MDRTDALNRTVRAGTRGREFFIYLDGDLIGTTVRTRGPHGEDLYLAGGTDYTGTAHEGRFATQAQAEAHLLDLRARQHRQSETASFQRSEEDGFLSQWAHRLSAEEAELQAAITERGGRALFPALFDTQGTLVAAKQVETRYGLAWGLLASDNPHDKITGWFNPSKAKDPQRARATDAKKGFFVGYVLAPARAQLTGANATSVCAVAVRTDGGYTPGAEVVCNGQGQDLSEGLGGVYGREAAYQRRHRTSR